MIAKQTRGSAASVSRMIDYVLRENGKKYEEEKADIFFQHGLCGNTADDLKEQIKMAIDLNKGKCKKPIFHAIFSLAENETINQKQENILSQKLIKEFGLEKNMVLGIKHTSPESKDHYHFLITLPPIDGGATPNMYKSKMRLMKISRECEKEFGLQAVLMPKQFLPPEQRSIPRQNKRKEKAKADLKKALVGTRSMVGFINNMNTLGYSLKKGRGLGVVENATGIYYKASDLDLSLGKIEKIIAFNEKLFNQDNKQSNNSERTTPTFTGNSNSETTDNFSKSSSFINTVIDILLPDPETLSSGFQLPGMHHFDEDEEELLRKRKKKQKRGFHR